MRVRDHVRCDDFPCGDVRHAAHHVPAVEVEPATVRVVLISEAVPSDPADGYEAPGDPLFARTTVEAFRDAGFDVATMLAARGRVDGPPGQRAPAGRARAGKRGRPPGADR